MSRTYRRKKDRKNRNCEVGFWNWVYEPDTWWVNYKYNGNAKKAKAMYHADNHSGRYSPPMWFYNEWFTKPERSQTRALLHKVKRSVYDGEELIFPHHRKPKEYYW